MLASIAHTLDGRRTMLLSRSRPRLISAATSFLGAWRWRKGPAAAVLAGGLPFSLSASVPARTLVARPVAYDHAASARPHPVPVPASRPLWLLLDDLPDGVIALDERGRISLINTQAERLFGYGPGELLCREIGILFQNRLGMGFDAGTGSVSRGQVGRREVVAIRKDGTEILVEVSRRLEPKGDARRVVLMVRDCRPGPEEVARARLAAIVDTSEDAIYSKSLDGTILSWNRAAERLYGYTSEEAVGSSVGMLIPHERSGEMEVILARLASGGQIAQFETSRVRKDGGEVWVSLSVAPTRDLGGRIVGASVIARDVTSQRRAKALVRESEERLRAVVESAAEGILLQDSAGRVLLTNPSAERILGRGLEGAHGAIVSGWCWRAIREDGTELPCLEQPVARTLRTGEALSDVVIGVRAPEGGTRWLSVNTVPVREPGETEPHAVVVSFFDITDIKRTEDALIRQYEEIDRRRGQIAAILDAAREAMVLIAPDGRVATANQRFYDLFDLDASVVAGNPLAAVGEPIRRRFGDDGFTALIGITSLAEECATTRSIRQVWPETHDFDIACAPVRGIDGAELGRLYSFLDVTREREVDRLKSDFVATVSHELRTPLTAISGFVDILVDGMVGELPPRVRHYLGVVQSNNRRLAGIIDDLLDISRIEAGRAELQRSEIDVAATIGAVVTSLGQQVSGKDQTLIVDLPPRLPAAWADAARVAQILTNLLSNAHKYTPAGGSITITAGVEEKEIRIEVSDTGIGLTAAEQERLFTKFFRSVNPQARQVSGTGLGLAITKTLVELHGGTMTVRSTAGEGSTFGFTLPLAPRAVELDRHESPDVLANVPTTMLVAHGVREMEDMG
jgi:PAS domain S-box-containing protein